MNKQNIIIAASDIGAGIRGAGLGPDAIRIAALEQNFKLFQNCPVFKLADENFNVFDQYPEHAFNIKTILNVLQNTCIESAKLLKKFDKTIIFSGDHSNAAGLVSGLCDAYPEKSTGLIWIDAHCDLHTPLTSPSGNLHGMPLAALLGRDNFSLQKNNPETEVIQYWNELKHLGVNRISPKIAPENLVFIDLRDMEDEEKQVIEKLGIKTFTPENRQQFGIEFIISETINHLSHCDQIYISFDVDSMDKSLVQGTGTPVSGGLQLEEAQELLYHFYRMPSTKILEITEVNPLLDNKNQLAKDVVGILKKVIKF